MTGPKIENPYKLGQEKELLIQRVASGNKSGIDEFLRRVHKEGTPDLPQITILPKYTLTIRATVGASLPPDFRRAIIQ